jgi:D-sedoheptulose 7-phosphate isomerase
MIGTEESSANAGFYDEILGELQAARTMLDQLIESRVTLAAIEEAALMLARVLAAGGKILVCGNGGSMSDAMHFASELTGRLRHDRNPLPALAISDSAYLTAVSNDFGYEEVFARYVRALGNPGDVLLAISTSGNSANVLNALSASRDRGMQVIALTGKDGGKLGSSADVEIRSPYSQYPGLTQEIHIKILHILASLVERLLGLSPAL